MFTPLKRKTRKLLNLLQRSRQKIISRKNTQFSAYLSIYNDWDILAPALASVAPYIDELVVVDGAYDWMIPYIEAIGGDPQRSNRQVYDILDASGIPYRCVNRVWKNEIEKRLAGYEACAHRYVYRIDADEIFFFDDAALESFLGSGEAIAEMHMPLYAAPGWIVRRTDLKNLPCQCFLFDRQQVSADIHLNYLWLVLTVDDLPTAGVKPFPVFGTPIAFNAHLTHWRTTDTAINRGAFYIMNWMRKNGAAWIPEMRGKPILDFKEVFRRTPAEAFQSLLLHGAFPMGTNYLNDNEAFAPTPLTPEQDKSFRRLHDVFLDKLALLNQQAGQTPQTVIFGETAYFDLSSAAARESIAPQGTALFLFSSPLSAAKITLHTLSTTAPQHQKTLLDATIDGNKLSFVIPPEMPSDALRQLVEIVCSSPDVIGHYTVASIEGRSAEKASCGA